MVGGSNVAQNYTNAAVLNALTINTGGTLANSFAALYDSGGTRRGVTADLSTTWQSTGYNEHSLASPYAATAGLYYVYLLVGSATTLPTFTRSSSSSAVNDGLSAGSFRWSARRSGGKVGTCSTQQVSASWSVSTSWPSWPRATLWPRPS